ncbi:MAG TPA: CinA family protein [Chryseosolibacter sp.]
MYDIELVNRIKDILISKNETLSIAESVTSGHLQAAVSLADKASEFYQGGATAYNLSQKAKLFHIDPVHAVSCNCVSSRVAAELAVGANNLFKSHWAVAITGYAAPIPALGVNDLFAHWAVARGHEVMKVDLITAKQDESIKVQLHYTHEVLKNFLALLELTTQ